MRIDTLALGASCALVWGAAVLLVACADAAWPGYGRAFLELLAAIYPAYDAQRSVGQIILVTLYALLDGAVFGLVIGWLYNRMADGGETR